MVNAKNIIEACIFLREKNQTIPDATISFMRGASLDLLKKISEERELKILEKSIRELKEVNANLKAEIEEMNDYG